VGLLKILKVIFKIPAPIIFITGRMGRGKTDFGLLISELALFFGWVKHVATNIKVFDERFTHITSYAELMSWMKLNMQKKLFTFDEASSNIPRRNPQAPLNKKITDIAIKLRKYRGHLIFIAVSQQLVDSIFEYIPDLVLGEFYKLNETTAVFKSQIFGDPIIVRNIPPTTVKFDTYDIAPFTVMPSTEGLQWMCCKVAKRYAEVRNLSKVANEFGILREQAKRLLIKHIQHTLGEEVTEKRGEDIIIEKKSYKNSENNVDLRVNYQNDNEPRKNVKEVSSG